jgi:hypothetical protein
MYQMVRPTRYDVAPTAEAPWLYSTIGAGKILRGRPKTTGIGRLKVVVWGPEGSWVTFTGRSWNSRDMASSTPTS